MKRLYTRTDECLRDLSRGRYAVVLGMAGGIGVLVVGLLLSQELLLVRAVTMSLVLFGLERTFGLHQRSEE